MKKILFILLFMGYLLGYSQVPKANQLVGIQAITTAEINAIIAPIEGTLIYNSENKFLYQYNGTIWQKLTPEGSDTKIISSGNISISGSGINEDPYIFSSVKPTFTTHADGSFTFSNGVDADVTFTPYIPGNTPIISSTDASAGNCTQFTFNETKDVSIEGDYFDGGTTVSIAGQTVNSVTIHSATQLTANVTSGNSYGDYDIVVSNNSGTGTLSGGFTLQVPTTLTTHTISQADMIITGECTYDGTTLSKDASAANGWAAQGYSTAHTINTNSGGRLDFTATQTNKLLMVGLSDAPALNASYTSIDFAMYLVTNSQIQIRESGASKGYQSIYATGDVLSIDVNCQGYVTYLNNGVVFYTSTSKAESPLFFDTSIYHPDAKVSNIMMTY